MSYNQEVALATVADMLAEVKIKQEAVYLAISNYLAVRADAGESTEETQEMFCKALLAIDDFDSYAKDCIARCEGFKTASEEFLEKLLNKEE